MANFIQAAEDVSYLLNDALRVNTVFTASGIVEANSPYRRFSGVPYRRLD